MSEQEKQQMKQSIVQLALYDQLTGLPNRNFLIEMLRQWVTKLNETPSLHKFAIITLDIDRFKLFNQSIGSPGGDALLNAVAQRLREIVRKDDIIARFGSDEFVLLVAMQPNDLIDLIAQRYHRMLSQSMLVLTTPTFVSISMGIAIAPTDAQDVEGLLTCANNARIQAKTAGGNQFQFYTTSMNQQAHKRLSIEQDLRHAIERNELQVYYQPKIAAHDFSLIGAEALVVWQHPKYGLLAPDDFIPIAEETGQIVDIGRWVLNEACQQTAIWRHDLAHFHIGINLSARQFLQDDLPQQVAQILLRYQLPAAALDLEVTESLAMLDTERSVHILNQLKSIGVQLALDDFGTGYSSLAYLSAFPVDSLKIDRAFVMRLGTEKATVADEKIVAAIIAMASSLELNVVAEGVENDYQANFLRTHGCHTLQGYYFGRPMSSTDFERLARARYNVTLVASAP